MISAQRRAHLLAPLSLLILCSAGCSKENKIDQSQRSSYLIDQNTSGYLPGPDGLGLRLTVGSVATPVTIDLAEGDPADYPPVPPMFTLAGKAYSFEPHGYVFKQPIVIELPVVPGGNGVITAEPGDAWSVVPSAQAGLFIQVQTNHFSFYAVTGGGTGTGDFPDASAGNGGSGGKDGGSSRIDSGAINGGECMDPGPQPTGTTDGTGMLAHTEVPPNGVQFTAKDGFVAYSQTTMQGGLGTTYDTVFSVVFTDYADACHTAMATNQTADFRGGSRGGRPLSKVLAVSMQGSSMSGPVDIAPGTYDGSGNLSPRPTFSGLDATCSPQMSQLEASPGSTVLTVTKIDATHVEGSLTINNPMSGDMFNGTFNFPICNLPDRATGPGCCMGAAP